VELHGDWGVCTVTVDAGGAGDGQLAADVTLDGRNIPVKVTAVQPGRYQASFVPDSIGVHQLRVYFAGVEISGELYEKVALYT